MIFPLPEKTLHPPLQGSVRAPHVAALPVPRIAGQDLFQPRPYHVEVEPGNLRERRVFSARFRVPVGQEAQRAAQRKNIEFFGITVRLLADAGGQPVGLWRTVTWTPALFCEEDGAAAFVFLERVRYAEIAYLSERHRAGRSFCKKDVLGLGRSFEVVRGQCGRERGLVTAGSMLVQTCMILQKILRKRLGCCGAGGGASYTAKFHAESALRSPPSRLTAARASGESAGGLTPQQTHP